MDAGWTRLRQGALQGVAVLLAYGIAEYVFLAMSLILKPHRIMLVQQWRGTVVLLAAYALIGALAGMAIAGFLRTRDSRRLRKALILAVLLVFGLNGLLAEIPGATRITIAGCVLLIGASVWFNLAGAKTDWGFGSQPVFAFGVLVCMAWAIANGQIASLAPLLRVSLVIGVTAILIVAAILARRLVTQLGERCSWVGVAEHSVKLAAVVLVVFTPSLMSSRAEGKQPVWPASFPSAARPNVILITLDTVRADHMGIYGYSRANTPHLRELLKESTLYTNFIAAAPLTLTSHASIFTGLYPQSHGAYKVSEVHFETGRPLAANIPTLADILNIAGYRTMAVAANRFYLGEEFGTLRGFRLIDWFAPTVLVAPERDYLLRNRLRPILHFEEVARDMDATSIPAEEVNRRAIELLDQARQDNARVFLFLNYMDAHAPYLPPPPYDRMYPGQDLGFTLKKYAEVAERLDGHDLPIKPQEREHLLSQYDGAIAYLDEKLGELIAHLKQNGQLDNTLFVITSDHGESFGDRNILGHDTSVYQDQVHIPLIVKYPGQTHPGRVDMLASHVDLMPTILDVLGIKVPSGVEGIDLRQAAPQPDRVVVAEMHNSAFWGGPRFAQIAWALYSGSHKMIYSSRGMRELYDLVTDPGEHHNLYRADAPETAALRARLVDWSSHTKPQFLDPELADREVEQRLKSLGYAHQGNQ